MAEHSRPLSPHLQVYRWPLNMALSILHRATGLALAAGTILLVIWLAAGASGPDAYAAVQGFIGSWIGQLLLFGWTLSLMFHTCSGIRHLLWDLGFGFDLGDATRGGQVVIAATVILTILAWVIGYAAMGH